MQTRALQISQATANIEIGFEVSEFLSVVISNNWVNGRYKRLVLEAPEAALAVKAGQFFHLLCPASDGGQPFLRRPMSVYRFDQANSCIEFYISV